MIRHAMWIWLVAWLCACTSQPQPLIIAASANMQYAARALAKAFGEDMGVGCEVIVSSSGKLTAQVRQGAPYDVFLSADTMYPYELYMHGYTTARPEVYAYGRLVLWTMVEPIAPSLPVLRQAKVRHIALANPDMAPYGRAAKEVLSKHELYDVLRHKLVFGESVSQVNQFVASQAAQVGFTSKSTVLSSAIRGQGLWVEVDSTAYMPIAQAAVVLQGKRTPHRHADAFYEYLFGLKGQRLLSKFGYALAL